LKKTRSLIGKTLLATLILMLLSVPFLPKALAYSAAALPASSVYFDPFRVEGNMGDTITVNLKISGITELYLFQAGLKWTNTTAVECTGVAEGGFLSNDGVDSVLAFPGTIDNTNGVIVPYGWSLLDTLQAKSGDGNLVTFTFHMLADGYSDIHLWEYSPLWTDGITEIATQTIDYFTAVMDGGQYIVEIVGNPMGSGVDNGFSNHVVSMIDITKGPDTYHGEISFAITAPGGANGDPFAFFNVTIPKALMSCPTIDQWWALLDGGEQAGRIVAENSTHATVSLEFAYSSNPIAVQIRSIDIVPEFSSIFFATLLVLATFAAALFGKTAWSHKRKS
jgi:hypothetical protein